MSGGRAVAFVRRTSKLPEPAPMGPVAVLFGLNFVDELDRIAFATLTPEIRDAFGLSDTGIAAVSVVTGLFLMFAAVPIGLAADRRSRVRLATLAAVLWGTMSVLTGVVTTVVLLVIVRFLSGLGRGMNEIVHPSLLADLYEPRDQPAVLSLHRLANPISAVAALVAGLIGATIGWRWAFVLLAIPTVPLLLAIHRMPEPPRGRYAVGTAPAGPLGAPPSAAPAPPSFRAAWRLMWEVRTLRRLWTAAFVFGMAIVPAAVFLTLFLEDEYGLGALGRGMAQFVLGAGVAAGILLGGRLAPRAGTADEVTPALAVHIGRWLGLGALGMVAAALAPTVVLTVAALALVGLGSGGLQPLLLALVGRVTPVACRSVAFGATALFIGIGAVGSLVLFGLGESTGYRPALVVSGLLVLGAAAVVTSARRCVVADLAREADAAVVGTAG